MTKVPDLENNTASASNMISLGPGTRDSQGFDLTSIGMYDKTSFMSESGSNRSTRSSNKGLMNDIKTFFGNNN